MNAGGLRQRLIASVDHEEVVARIVAESGWTARYAFMILMSAGIAVLGLLLSSPAVVIGAMLISPLMSPILGLGFSLTLFDFGEMRRSLAALVVGTLLAVAFTALVVLVSPLKAPTAEILARTRPNLFDLLVALFASLAGTFAIIRGRGETIVGVAIATALMPPLAVVGFGLATGNLPVLGGASALFATNFLTIALSATIMARVYGFGHRLSDTQSWAQTIVLGLVFTAMAVPLALSLGRIAREALITTEVRSFLTDTFGTGARLTQFDLDFDRTPLAVRAVVITPRSAARNRQSVERGLAAQLGRPVRLQLDELLLDPSDESVGSQRAELERATQAAAAEDEAVARITDALALAAGVPADAVTVDREHHRAIATAVPLAGASLATYRALEQRAAGAADGWDAAIVPPLGTLPAVRFASGADTLDGDASAAVVLSAWAARRWNVPALQVPGLPATGEPPARPVLSARRALAIAAMLRDRGVGSLPAPPGGQSVVLSVPLSGPAAPARP